MESNSPTGLAEAFYARKIVLSSAMRVLVTGSDGYIGSVLGPYLGERGFDVVGVDTGFYRDAALYDAASARIETLARDIRHLREADLAGFDAVVHLAELLNDPLGEIAPTITYEINHRGSVQLANGARRRWRPSGSVYTSSCSVYGVPTKSCRLRTRPTQSADGLCRL